MRAASNHLAAALAGGGRDFSGRIAAWPSPGRRDAGPPEFSGHLKFAGFACNQLTVGGLADVADRAAAIVSNQPLGVTPERLLLCGAAGADRGFEGTVMVGGGKSWVAGALRFGRSHVLTQAAVLLPVVTLAVLAVWTMPSAPTSARGAAIGQSTVEPGSQTVRQAAQTGARAALPVSVQEHEVTRLPNPAPAPAAADPAASRASPAVTSPAVNGLKISWQTWHRGGLGSNALVSFTLRNNNDYAVKDIEIACAFSRRDGSHLTDRKRIITDAVVGMRSRKTFAHVHVGFVNIDANKAKCTPVAASRT